MYNNNTLQNLCPPGFSNIESSISSIKSKTLQNKKPKIYSTYRNKKHSTDSIVQRVSKQPKKLSKWTQNRVDQICRRFIRKLKQGVVLQTAYNVNSDQNQFDFFGSIFGKTEGFDPNNIWIIILDMFCLIMRFFLGILFSLDIVFEVGDLKLYTITQVTGMIFFFVEIALSFATKVDKQGRRISQVKDISKYYLKGAFPTDIIYFGLILTDLVAPASKIVTYVRLIAAVYKLIYSLQRVDKIQKISFSNYQAEQIWGIFLVLLVNFIFAHSLSLVMNAIAQANPGQNWWYMKNCQDDQWYIKYIYGAYWGTNIMLTVGFGDICATNWMQALSLIFIQMISCVVLSYNISCLGGLITNLRKNNQDKNRNVRLFNRMYDQQTSNIQKKPIAMKDKVYQFFDSHYQTKKQFNLEDEKQVLSIFPDSLKQTYFKQIYFPVIKYLPIIRKFSTECLQKMVNTIQKIFVYPDNFIIKTGDSNKIIILSKGQASFVFTRKNKKITEHSIIQKISVESTSSLISGKQAIFNEPSKYSILSTQFSVVNIIPGDSFRQIIKMFTRDHQNMCKMKDSENFNDLVLSCIQCKICHQTTHTKFNCPMLHYSPLKSIVITRSQSFTYKQHRVFVVREKSSEWNLMRKSQLVYLPKTQKSIIPTMNYIKRDSKVRKSTVYYENFETINYDFDRVHTWNVYFPQSNMQFRKDQDLDSDSD